MSNIFCSSHKRHTVNKRKIIILQLSLRQAPSGPAPTVCLRDRASDKVRKKTTNYAEIFRNIMRKKVLIMRKTRWIMRKIFGSLRSPKIHLFMQPKSSCPQRRESARRLILNKKIKLIMVFGLFQLFSFVFGTCYEIILSIM